VVRNATDLLEVTNVGELRNVLRKDVERLDEMNVGEASNVVKNALD
jgi:hypothetical protein